MKLLIQALLALLFLAATVGAQDRSADALKLFQAGAWDKAAAAYADITRSDPADAMAWFRLGTSLYQLNRDADAIAAYEHADTLGVAGLPPGFVTFRIGRSYARLGDAGRAVASLAKAVDAGFAPLAQLETAPDFAAIRDDARFKEVVARARKIAYPCEFADGYRQFDFWIGDWDVYSGPGLAGTSRVERILNDCVIFENWTSTSGNAGKSFNTYDPAKNEWHQTWVDNAGLRTEYHGGLVNGEMIVVAEQVNAKGQKTLQKMTYTRLADGKVRQHGESSTDDGKTWTTTYDLEYRKKT